MKFLFRCLILAGAAFGTMAAVSADTAGFVRITPDAIQWRDVPDGKGVQVALLEGDDSKPGLYVMRAKFPPHIMDRPHWHPNARYVTVLQGTWYAGTGDRFDLQKAIPMPPGSFMMHPARAPHWDGSATDETVIVQIVGYGPGKTTLVDPKQPMWLEVPHPK
ncbi:MAG TPA: cupin domain-containing protein [Steroidobacteraceae bacterium]|nr:cupin domain-containing protein [Steroidobacteraceae bacterium]